MLDFNDQIDDISLHCDDDDGPRRTLSSIFKKNQRIKVRELKLSGSEDSQTVALAPLKTMENPLTETSFNTKLSWLKAEESSKEPEKTQILSLNFQNDYPVLSSANNKIITKMCPKIKDGFKCSRTNCNYQHPQVEEVKKIVSDMRSLKKRVIKDVLKVIDTPDKKKKKSITHVTKPSFVEEGRRDDNNRQMKICRFQEKCKFKETCSYAHSLEELNLKNCQYGSKCKLVSRNADNGQFINTNSKKKCGFIHPNESKDMFVARQK